MNLNNIVKVEKIVAENLDMVRTALDEVVVDNTCVFTEVECVTPVSVESAGADDDKNNIYNHKMVLKVMPGEQFPNYGHYAFRLTTASGKRYLFGANERPWVMISSNETHPDVVKNQQGLTITLEYKSIFSLPQIR